MIRFVVMCLCTLFFSFTTSHSQTNDEAVQQLYSRANESFDEGWYKKSINLFKELNEQYPFNVYESYVSLKIADAYFELGQYLDAIETYSYFEGMYPLSKFIPYILYKKSKAFLNQTCGLSKDQICTKKALDCYSKLVTLFPENEYTGMASDHIDACYENLSGYEFRIGLFYYKNKKYTSAISRFIKLISAYPDNGYHYQALLYLAECDRLIRENKHRE